MIARTGGVGRRRLRAAWLVAVHTYLDEGYADGILSATVHALDADLFAQLPDVLQVAETAPASWVTPPIAIPVAEAPAPVVVPTDPRAPIVVAAAQGAAARWTYLEYNLLDLESAEHIILDKKRLGEIIGDDLSLSADFERERKKYRKLPEYIRRYTDAPK